MIDKCCSDMMMIHIQPTKQYYPQDEADPGNPKEPVFGAGSALHSGVFVEAGSLSGGRQINLAIEHNRVRSYKILGCQTRLFILVEFPKTLIQIITYHPCPCRIIILLHIIYIFFG